MQKKAFTIIEILIAITIVSIVLIMGFQAYAMILAGKVKLIERTNLQKDAFFFSERLFQEIKKGGTIDYEEYFNRWVVQKEDLGLDLKNGHYGKNTGFGNFGPGGQLLRGAGKYGLWHPYLCISGVGETNRYNPENGCFNGTNATMYGTASAPNGLTTIEIIVGQPQKYGQYAYQFWDYNSDADGDGGDHDSDGDIVGDDDDKGLGNGPEVFRAGDNLHELYLISGNKKTRTFFRWHNYQDNDAKDASGDLIQCNNIGEGCRGTIEFLQLQAKDWGWDNNSTTDGSAANDGIIDTWVIDEKFRNSTNCRGVSTVPIGSDPDQPFVAGQFDTEGCRKSLFPDSLNVSNFKVYAYPNKDMKLAWAEDPNKIASGYVTISLTIEPSWAIKRKIRGDIPPLSFNTTVNLTDIFSK